MRETYALTRQNRTVFLSVLGVSWFWFFGAAVLALLPIYAKSVLYGDEHVITLSWRCSAPASASVRCSASACRTASSSSAWCRSARSA